MATESGGRGVEGEEGGSPRGLGSLWFCAVRPLVLTLCCCPADVSDVCMHAANAGTLVRVTVHAVSQLHLVRNNPLFRVVFFPSRLIMELWTAKWVCPTVSFLTRLRAIHP